MSDGRPIPLALPRDWQRRRLRRQAGHSLIEVMIASAVFSIGALGLLSLMYRSSQGTSAAQHVTQASALCRTKLGELQRLPYAQLVNGTYEEKDFNGDKNIGPAGTPFNTDGGAAGAWGSPDGMFYRSWSISTDGTLAYKVITVTVQWYDAGAKSVRTITVTGGKSEL